MSNFSDNTGWYTTDWTGYDLPTEVPGINQPYSSQSNTYSPYGNFNYSQAPNSAAPEILDEPPLLEELGINFDHIFRKTLSVLNPFRNITDPSVANDCDLSGPIVFALLFGAALLLHGKVQFGFIYGVGAIGCVGLFLLLNLMTPCGISFISTVSIVGYCLLPMVILSSLAAVLSFKGAAGYTVTALAILWCSVSASKLFVTALSMDHQRLLVAYPCSLLYGVFGLMAIF